MRGSRPQTEPRRPNPGDETCVVSGIRGPGARMAPLPELVWCRAIGLRVVVQWPMNHPAAPLELTESQRATLEAIAKSSTAAHREVLRARVLLMAADGTANSRTAEQVGVSVPTVLEWRARFAAEGLVRFGQVRKGRGRKPEIPQAKIDEIVRLTQEPKPEGQTHWSCRSMAKATGVSAATVQRAWSSRGLKPHLVETFKLSNDKRFDEKLVDVVGLYLGPRTRPSCCAWTRSRRSRPSTAPSRLSR